MYIRTRNKQYLKLPSLKIEKNRQKGKLEIGIYHKRTSNNIVINKESDIHTFKKISAFNTLIHRLITIPLAKKGENTINNKNISMNWLLKMDSIGTKKLIRKHKAKQQKFTVLKNIETEKSNNWISFTFTGNETARISSWFKKMENTCTYTKTEHFNKYDTKGIYELTCVNCKKMHKKNE